MRSQPAADLPTLTALRFFAALMIFVFHLREFAPSETLYALAPGMFQGVSFFFVLSGFVLTHAYAGREIPLAAFYRARFARIAPLHVVCLLGLLAVVPLPVALGQSLDAAAAAAAFALKLSMLDAWVPLRAVQSSWNSVSWSISVEMAFYAAFPFLSMAMARRPLSTLAGAVAVSLGVLAAGVVAGLPTFVPDGSAVTLVQLGSFFPPARGFEFVLGMATCLVWRRWVVPARLSDAVWTGVETAVLAFAALWLCVLLPWLVFHTQGAVFVGLRAAGSSWLFAALLCALAGGRGRLGRALSAPWWVKLGQVSFAFYLVHVIVMRALEWRLGATGVWAPFALSLGLAFLLHEGVEIPMRRRLLARPFSAGQPARAL